VESLIVFLRHVNTIHVWQIKYYSAWEGVLAVAGNQIKTYLTLNKKLLTDYGIEWQKFEI